MVLHGDAWYCMVLHGIAWHYIVFHGNALSSKSSIEDRCDLKKWVLLVISNRSGWLLELLTELIKFILPNIYFTNLYSTENYTGYDI